MNDIKAVITDEFVDRNAVVGSVEACLARLRQLWLLGLDHFVVVERSEKSGPARTAVRCWPKIAVREAVQAEAEGRQQQVEYMSC